MTIPFNLWTLLVSGLPALLGVAWILVRHLMDARPDRRALSRELLGLRLSGVMQAMGVEPLDFARLQPSRRLARHVRTCSICRHGQRCTADLARAAPGERFAYCPAEGAIRRARRRISRQRDAEHHAPTWRRAHP